MNLNFNVSFNELYTVSGIHKINTLFNQTTSNSESLTALAVKLEEFIINLFGIGEHYVKIQKKIENALILNKCKQQFVKKNKYIEIDDTEFEQVKKEIEQTLQSNQITDIKLAKNIIHWMSNTDKYKSQLLLAQQYISYSIKHKKHPVLTKLPIKLNYSIPFQKNGQQGILHAHKNNDLLCSGNKIKIRDRFNYTNKDPSTEEAISESKYCLICHIRKKDSCSTGYYKKSQLQQSEVGTPLTGCPLQQKISEAHELLNQGHLVAAFILIMIDNPMCAATGQHICNECKISCIFQKQTPVDIPQVESYILQCILSLNYGFEIYSLLSKWNPLRISQPLPKEYNGQNILISGMGPAGFTLAYYLSNAGCNIVGIDGIKIEPLTYDLVGQYDKKLDQKLGFQPIKHIHDHFSDLQKRIIYGFGGVMEYGITSRWNKNLLLVIRLLLERRNNFLLKSGITLNNYNYTQIKNLGFHHVALTSGAGNPRYIDLETIH
ncbi:MAG: hypothetical protein P857_825 [Candidatus Xenolissoclinum pacificiensis L6]|uniref:Uncharacterized protein n=1 Tax=Candidatus Xenolissoclinum pacificiensis L6 TaxID=1401685 RepID=W2V0M8_9RICK|nr:MAG: hypothetical protein P857_825 [Candidatus Xenolissoclinum pacificiensis L6]